MNDWKAGGGGVCKYCNEYHGNVSLHSAHHCRKNPHLFERFRRLDEELHTKIMEVVTKNNRTIESEHYIVVENEFENHSVEFKDTHIKIAEGIPFASQAVNLMRQLEWGIVKPKDVVVFRSKDMNKLN